jgi:SAM-dependent methyltransferase
MSSEERFGFEWGKYSSIDSNYKVEFKNWIYPLGPGDFKKKRILDAGCGMGRNSYWMLKWGAGSVTAFDFDKRSVEASKKNLSQFKNVKVLFKSIYETDWQDEFDVVFCVGVIHHLKDPKLAIRNLVRALKPEGKLVIWVYGYEGYEWIVRYVNPVRKNVTSRLPVRLVHFLSYFCSIPLWLFVKIFRGPTPYLKQYSKFGFKHMHSNVFDQLIPDIANYWKKGEVEELFSGVGLKNIDIHYPPNKCGWCIQASK